MFYYASSELSMQQLLNGTKTRGFMNFSGSYGPHEESLKESMSLGETLPPIYTAYAPSMVAYASHRASTGVKRYGDYVAMFDVAHTYCFQALKNHACGWRFIPRTPYKLDKKRLNSLYYQKLHQRQFLECHIWKETPPVKGILCFKAPSKELLELASKKGVKVYMAVTSERVFLNPTTTKVVEL